MNERIEQLLEQARAECFRFGSKPATTVGYDELEKFAELIVRECSAICLNENVSNVDIDLIHQSGKFTVQDLATKSCGENLAKRIKEHFGVG